MKTKLGLLSIMFVTILAFGSCMKTPMACCDIPTTGAIGESLKFSSTCSTDASTYEWDFGDGTKSTEANPTHTYTSAATYKVKLMAMSKNGKKMNEISKSITVN